MMFVIYMSKDINFSVDLVYLLKTFILHDFFCVNKSWIYMFYIRSVV